MKIAIVATGKSEEVADLLNKAAPLGVECEYRDVNDPNLTELDADVIYWRSATVSKHFKKAVGRSVVMKRLGAHTKLVNAVLTENPNITNKSYQQAHLAAAAPHMRGIETFLARDREALEALINAQKLVYPFIAKPDHGSKGKGVELIESEKDLEKLGKLSEYVYQNYIPNDCDYRIFVVGGAAIDVVRRRASSESTKAYLNNMSQGGTAEKVSDEKLYYELAQKAERIAAAFDFTICGVDLIQNSETGDIHFMEINSVPQWVVFGDALSADIGTHVLLALTSIGEDDGRLTPEKIKTYYDRHLPVMYPRKAFHYLSRMYLWTRDAGYRQKLDDIREAWFPDPKTPVDLAARIPDMEPPKRSGGRGYRKAHYTKHFKLYKYNLIFFKALFLETIYDEPLSKELIAAIDTADLTSVRTALLADEPAVLALSTHAVNFLYHYAHFFGEPVRPKRFLDIGDTEVLPDVADDVESRAYMYTHAIIGASKFYSVRPITENVHIYLEMLRRVEDIVQHNFPIVPLDVKCEFLVCAKLLEYESRLKQAITCEIEASRSPHGDFIVDTLNIDNNMAYKKAFQASGHRNVLALMALDE